MSKFTEVIFHVATGETTIRPFNEKEIDEAEALQKLLDKQQKELAAKQAARENAQAKLAALGLTEDEIAAL